MRPCNTFDRGLSLLAHQNTEMNTHDPEAVQAALQVSALLILEYIQLCSHAIRQSPSAKEKLYQDSHCIIKGVDVEATRAQIQALQAQLGTSSGVAIPPGSSGLGTAVDAFTKAFMKLDSHSVRECVVYVIYPYYRYISTLGLLYNSAPHYNII